MRDKIQVGSYTIIGDRGSQQDAMRFIRKDDVLLCVVCDGMGGMAGGERASQLAIQTIFQMFQNEKNLQENQFSAWMQRAFVAADAAVNALTDDTGNPLHAGTTVVAVMIKDERMYWGCVGDSRIYLIHQDQIQTVTRMHNYNLRLEDLYQKGEISDEELKRERTRGEALISFLGIGGLPLLDTSIHPHPLEEGDMLILCSDGVYKSLDDQQVLALAIESGGNMQIAAQRICDDSLRLATGKQDNTTVIAIGYVRR